MKQGLFNHDDLTVKFGGALSKPENIFVAKAVKVPDYTITVREQESEPGGWYIKGSYITRTVVKDRIYLIFRDNKCIGYMQAYHKGVCNNCKSDLYPITANTNSHIINHLNTLTL